MAKIKYCIWDVGNVIYNYSLDPLHDWCEQHTSDFNTFQERKDRFSYNDYMKGLVSYDELCRQLCDFYQIPYQEKYKPEINKAFHSGIKNYIPETLQMQQELQSKGIENCILSNALPILARSNKAAENIDPEHIFCSFDLGLLKPDPQIYTEVRNKLDCRFEELIFVDDKAKNTAAAAKLGIHAVTFNPQTIKKEINKILTTPLLMKQKEWK